MPKKITSTTWEIEPHTKAKHIILRKYLDAWLPIMTSWAKRVLYIDGFSGPGEYSDGSDGSPIVAIKCVEEHTVQNKAEIVMLFIEKEKERFDYLENKLKQITIPSRIQCQCVNGEFRDQMEEILNFLEEGKKKMAPSFVFIDPFGFTGIPMSIIKRIMSYKSCEVFITFMFDDINRFIEDKKLESNFKELFGVDDDIYLKAKSKTNPDDRRNFLHDLYKRQLETVAGIKYVRSFMMKNSQNHPKYFLFFGTNNIVGLKAMKNAMWKVDESGNYKFSDTTYNPSQDTLFEVAPNLIPLEKQLYDKFKNSVVKAKDLRGYTLINTPYLIKHCNEILKKKEKTIPPTLVRVCDPCTRNSECRKRKGCFNEDCDIKLI